MGVVRNQEEVVTEVELVENQEVVTEVVLLENLEQVQLDGTHACVECGVMHKLG
jgi:hypothetical protein